jgi:hypothetical protein
MRAILATGLMSITVCVASAEPVHLACVGEVRLQNASGETVDHDTLSVVIDQTAGTVTVGSRAPVQIMSKPDADALVFQARPGSREGVSTGTIDRFTGASSIHIIRSDGLYKFYGQCRPAQRLF